MNPHPTLIVKQFLCTFVTRDPQAFHYDIATKVLEKSSILDSSAADILSKQFLEACRDLNKRIQCLDEKIFLFVLDKVYLTFLSKIGPRGEEYAKKIKEKLKREADSKRLLDFWLCEIQEEVKPSMAFFILCEAVWEDIGKRKWERNKRSSPSIPKAVWIDTLKPTFAKDSKIVIIDNILQYFSNQGTLIASTPCVDPKLLNLIKRGMEGFSTLTGHKLLRWQVRIGFENWMQDKKDPRLICTSGGYEGIAHLIGCNHSNKAITEVKTILHAQAYSKFSFPNGSQGNMITLLVKEKCRNGEASKINIILGEWLLPNYTHALPQGERRRLIPIIELPPMVCSKNSYAAQAMLQLLILEEFSNQSHTLAEKGSIYLPKEKWFELSTEAHLTKNTLQAVIACWTQDGDKGKAFLSRQGDEYTLGESYRGVLKFLEYQGTKRNEGSSAGKKSAFAKNLKQGVRKRF